MTFCINEYLLLGYFAENAGGALHRALVWNTILVLVVVSVLASALEHLETGLDVDSGELFQAQVRFFTRCRENITKLVLKHREPAQKWLYL